MTKMLSFLKLGLSTKIALLCLGPSLLISLAFSFFFIDAKIDGVEESLKRQGSNILVHLSPEIHLALAREEKISIQEALEDTRTKYRFIDTLSVIDNEGKLIAGDPSPFPLKTLNQDFNPLNHFPTDASETIIQQDASHFYFLMKPIHILVWSHLTFLILQVFYLFQLQHQQMH
jgi:hypothetical protein